MNGRDLAKRTQAWGGAAGRGAASRLRARATQLSTQAGQARQAWSASPSSGAASGASTGAASGASTGAGAGASTQASEEDVATAYRLLLGREPDPSGLALYEPRWRAGELQVGQLAEELVTSVEFARRWPQVVVFSAPEPVEVEVGHCRMFVQPKDWAVGAAIAVQGSYEPEVTAAIRSLLGPGDTFVDVGANIGWHSLLAASIVGDGGTVVSIEPNVANCELLARSVEVNGFTSIDVVTAAVGDEPAWLGLITDASNGRVFSLGPIEAGVQPTACSYVVPSFRLDDLLTDRGVHGDVKAMKVDVEGVETAAFRGAARLLDEVRPHVVFEWFPWALSGAGATHPDAPLDLLRSHGYSLSVIGDDGPGGGGIDLTNEAVEGTRLRLGRDLLDILATPPPR